jgi:acyl dehydratase
MKFEEFRLGQEFSSHPYTVTREEMLSFSRDWDHQPMHVDDERAAQGRFGEIIASGFMTVALAWKLWLEIGVQEDDGEAGISLDGLVWHKPLFAGTTVRNEVRVVEHRLTKAGHGLVTFEFRLRDEEEDVVSFRTTGLFQRMPVAAG